MVTKILENKWHCFILILLAATASTGSLTACPPPPECDTPDRYVLWAKNTGVIFAQSEENKKVYLDSYSAPHIIQYILVGQNYVNFSWCPFVDWDNYSWGSPNHCGYCISKSCSFSKSGGITIASTSNTITISYGNIPLSGSVSGTHGGWNCYKDGYGAYIIGGGSQITMDVYVVKVDIKRNGVSIVDQNPTVSVGEKITLTGTVEPAAIVGQSPQWNIYNSPIKNYIANANEGRVENLTSLDYNSNGISYYWYKGAEDVYVGYTVIINGSYWGAQTHFDVKKPTALTSVTRGPINVLNQKFSNGSPGSPGIGITINSVNLNGCDGNLSWTQLFHETTRRIYDARGQNPGWFICAGTSTNNVRILDGMNITLNPFIDSPYVITHADFTTIEVEDHLYVWLMFKPSSSGSIYIPLMNVYWYWEGVATNNNNPGENLDNKWNVSNYNKNDGLSMQTTNEFPLWNRNKSILQWIHE